MSKWPATPCPMPAPAAGTEEDTLSRIVDVSQTPKDASYAYFTVSVYEDDAENDD